MSFVRGISFPFRLSAGSLPAPATDAEVIRDSLIQIIGVARDERPMRPNFGCDITKYLFEQDTAILAESIITEVQAAIVQNEPRVFVSEVTVSRLDEDEETIVVTINYVIISTRQEQTIQITL